ncbi:hypothetical protein DICSQDRAFT_63986 [Dichomitus squalens LYAD-421 SS1]|uniref:Zn(2)-C6 fungal-type domain-containing protein n=1 Tax=Dichomitus squalens (strain LYAD-421) TaxID=732165 RepID=R7SY32_DICSQ|nr:uncharacterized protein DICSQDRAFT_63986 [Dichomitus squalens LYAD-421 SS1]EJF59892.1 hypothetical protein DICSQDRAFT_63986 [Dichomitus squalens LYAD-421 SS1]
MQAGTSQQPQNQESDDDVYDMPRTPRRTPMACQFCRGRKLKCDGRQTCANCQRRGIPCTYVPMQVQLPVVDFSVQANPILATSPKQ